MGSCSTPCSLESLLLHGSNVEKAHACPSLTSTLLRSFSAQALQEYWDMNPDLEAELRDLWREDPEAVEASRWCVCVCVHGYACGEAPEHFPSSVVPFRLYGDEVEISSSPLAATQVS